MTDISINLQKQLLNYIKNEPLSDDNPLLYEIIDIYLNDKNSSTLRQYITAVMCEYENSFKKLGYDAIDKYGFHKEIKPVNISSNKISKRYGMKIGFSDYTLDRFENDVKNNVNILHSLFVDGKLIYIIEFPIKDFENKLKYHVDKEIIQNKQRYIRKAEFSFKDVNINNVIIKFKVDNFESYKDLLTKSLYEYILTN